MRFTLADTPPEQAACDLLALPVPDPGTLQGEVADVDRAAGGRLAEVARVALLARHGDRALLLRGQQAAEVAIRATSRARDLVNEPANVLTPTALAEIAQEIAGSAGLTCRVFDLDEARTMGMGLFAAVAQGSAQPPKFIVMDYRPTGARRTVALAGKGITFDSGGLSIKTAGGMMTMKGDMAGAARAVGP